MVPSTRYLYNFIGMAVLWIESTVAVEPVCEHGAIAALDETRVLTFSCDMATIFHSSSGEDSAGFDAVPALVLKLPNSVGSKRV